MRLATRLPDYKTGCAESYTCFFAGLNLVWSGNLSTDVKNLAVENSALANLELGYAGDVTAQQAHAWAQADQAIVVDIRTDAERAWVGWVPGAMPLAFKQWPGMQLNPDFDREILKLGGSGKKLVLLCRSGIRSIAAARRATALGLQAYNILEGFEGEPDEHSHRGQTGGWRFHGLPWSQD